jgi:phosphoglycerate dehydrogenase-like enzyme
MRRERDAVTAVTAVATAALADDFDLGADDEGVLDRLDLHIVERPERGQPGLANAEILITGLGSESSPGVEFVRNMPRLRWVHSVTAGVEEILFPDLLERGILVTNGAGAYATAIAEYVFAAMVLLARSVPTLILEASRRRWVDDHPLGTELAGKQLGIVGFGAIGRALADLGAAAGMVVWGLRRRTSIATGSSAERVVGPDELPELLASSDFVALAASLNASSRGLIGAAELRLMKPGAYLVNVSRGALLDEAALVTALTEERLAGAMLDVTGLEPLPATSELWRAPNLWLTPHVSGGSNESRDRAFRLLLANLYCYLADRLEDMVNIVDLRHELAADGGVSESGM